MIKQHHGIIARYFLDFAKSRPIVPSRLPDKIAECRWKHGRRYMYIVVRVLLHRVGTDPAKQHDIWGMMKPVFTMMMEKCNAWTKDYLHRDIDVPKVFFAIVNLPNSELYLRCICYKPAAGQYFPDCGVWVSVDFDSKYKIV